MSLTCQIWLYLRCTTGCFGKCMHYENITAVKLNNLSITSAQLPCVCVCVQGVITIMYTPFLYIKRKSSNVGKISPA